MITRRISVVAAMLNEAAHVSALVEDLAAQDFDGELEIFVADGGSTDGSAKLLADAAERAELELTILHNPRRIASVGLNACIRRCTGELIVRLDCHSRYPADYLRRCARAADETGAWNVGGVYVPTGATATERAAACALATAFGGVNWTRDGGRGERVTADTVYLGAFRPIAFEQAGLYAEDLVRNQDDELNLRIRRVGGRVVLDPAIRARYVPRGTFGGLARQYYEYGRWKPVVMARHRQVLSMRSLMPSTFVGSLGVLGLAAINRRPARRFLGLEVGLYAAAAVGFGFVALRRQRESVWLLPRTVAVYPTLHLSYGLGMTVGTLRLRSRGGSRRRTASGAA